MFSRKVRWPVFIFSFLALLFGVSVLYDRYGAMFFDDSGRCTGVPCLHPRGCAHFLMEADMKVALDKAVYRYKDEISSYLRDRKSRYLGVIRESGNTLTVKFKDQAALDDGLKELTHQYQAQDSQLNFTQMKATKEFALSAVPTEINISNIKKMALQQNIATLRNRISEMDIVWATVRQQGLERIVVQLPGVQDPTPAKKILGATGMLEFRMVDENNNAYDAQANKRVPIGSVLYKERNGNPILLKRSVMLTSDFISNANATYDQNNQPAVNIALDSKGARMFEKATGENVKKLMGVVFIETKTNVSQDPDGNIVKNTVEKQEVINVARIQEKLSSRFQITGLDSIEDANSLALLLRAGAMATPVYIVEERKVGPNLGCG